MRISVGEIPTSDIFKRSKNTISSVLLKNRASRAISSMLVMGASIPRPSEGDGDIKVEKFFGELSGYKFRLPIDDVSQRS